ncbi:MAG: hypothetical protein EXS40_11050, partial [Opitutaceae bacterium]|nr:hypothetical protein [Opitutaceae bacterium]
MKITTKKIRSFCALALIAAATEITGIRLVAAEAKTTQMEPFNVAAEFGVDGLRIQNSQSVLNQYLLEQHGVAQ